MTGAEFSAALKKNADGAYLFCGEEDYLKRHYLTVARKAVLTDPATEVFNHILLDADTFSTDAFAQAVQSCPMMADRKLIEIKGISLDGMNETDTEDFCEILRRMPEFGNNLVILTQTAEEFDAGTEKIPSKRLKALSKFLTPVLFPRETPARLNRWAEQHFSSLGVFAPAALCAVLVGFTGRDMYTLHGEIEKLAAFVRFRGDDHLTEEDIRRVACQNLEPDPFGFANAILGGKTEEALVLLNDKKLRREPPELILGGVSRVFSDLILVRTLADSGLVRRDIAQKLKMHEYKTGLYLDAAQKKNPALLKKSLALCYEADRKIKSTPLDAYVILDRLVAETATLR